MTDLRAPSVVSPPAPGRLAGLAAQPELAVAAALFVLLLATAGGYGWFRDELYFLTAGRHLDWGYPDQPVFTPAVVAALHWLGGGSLVVVRSAAALASAASVVLLGMIAAEAGGGRAARLVAALSWAVGGWALNTGHFVETGSFDLPAGLAVCWCVLRAVRTERPQPLAWAGAALGFGLLNKLTVGMAAAALLLGLLALGPRRLLWSRRAFAGGALAVLGALPYLGWQAANGWPQADLAASIATVPENGPLGVLAGQLFLTAPYLAPLLVLGLVEAGRRHRPFLLGYLLLLAFLVVTHGRGYYAGALVATLTAFGAVAGVRLLRAAWQRRVAAVAFGVAAAVSLVVNAIYALPLIPVRDLPASGVNAENGLLGEQVGWPQLVDVVAGVRDRVPAADRASTVVFTANYGEAGAIDTFGASRGLTAFSGHNGYGHWGPPDGAGPVVLVGFQPGSAVAGRFAGCRQEALVDNEFRLDNVEAGMPVLLCGPPPAGWAAIWPELVHDDLGVTLTAEEKRANLRSAGAR